MWGSKERENGRKTPSGTKKRSTDFKKGESMNEKSKVRHETGKKLRKGLGGGKGEKPTLRGQKKKEGGQR